MSFTELTPAQLLAGGLTAPEITGRAWRVTWSGPAADIERLVLGALPPEIDLHTSGSTGPSRCWRRLRANTWLEAGMLAELVAPERPEAVLSFVPPVHLYGALATVLMPAHLRVPAWFRPTFLGALPAIAARRVVVVATPWIFSLLLENLPWVRALDHVTVLHGGAMLPASAGEFLAAAGADRALVVEVLGSTEAGGVATRRWRTGEPPPWTLFRDVEFAGPEFAGPEFAGPEFAGPERGSGEVPLRVRSPRLAFPPGGEPPPVWELDDQVEPIDARRFRFAGRRSRLVKVNGRRINLDETEHALRAVADCADLALRPVTDAMIGEHVDLLVVPGDGRTLADVDLSAVFAVLGVRPRRVHAVPRIERSEIGKVRHIQPAVLTQSEVTP
jgi:acyl-coenzyme A synthetase/AMP-(fatty) acid ligase